MVTQLHQAVQQEEEEDDTIEEVSIERFISAREEQDEELDQPVLQLDLPKFKVSEERTLSPSDFIWSKDVHERAGPRKKYFFMRGCIETRKINQTQIRILVFFIIIWKSQIYLFVYLIGSGVSTAIGSRVTSNTGSLPQTITPPKEEYNWPKINNPLDKIPHVSVSDESIHIPPKFPADCVATSNVHRKKSMSPFSDWLDGSLRNLQREVRELNKEREDIVRKVRAFESRCADHTQSNIWNIFFDFWSNQILHFVKSGIAAIEGVLKGRRKPSLPKRFENKLNMFTVVNSIFLKI